MRSLAFAFAFAVVMAGCASSPGPSPGPSPIPPPRVLFAPDCSIATPDSNWTEPCVAKASGNPSPSKTEIDLAVNPTDPLNVIVGSKDLDRTASNCVWAVPQVTHDGGKTWKTVYIGGKKADRKPGDALFGWECITDPIMTFDSKGGAHYSLQIYNFQTGGSAPAPVPVPGVGNLGSEIVMVSSTNGGDSWGDFVTLHAGDGNAVFHDYMRMASNPKTNTVYTIWNQISSAGPTGAGASVPVLVAVKAGATSAQPPVYVPVPADPGNPGETAIFTDAAGTVHVILAGSGAAYLTSSTDDGATFGAPVKILSVTPIKSPLPNTKFRVGTSVEGAIDRSNATTAGCMYAVWSDGAKGEGDSDIMSSHSCDKGKTWTMAARVNRDNTKTDQIMPRIAVGSDGTVHVVYLTRAYDAANNTRLDAEYAYSTDGGASWASKRLTAKSFDGDKGVHQDGFPFFGDYIGIDSAGARTYAGFPDSVTGVAEIGVAALVAAH